ncbi:MAG: 50S ribosomal protein L24 [Candidatus Omnitrophica bacterium CG1_02_49_10]|nr:MAG: 50S ribosomal protein L24 [Candidatus Omnitrophica bacterium CG1_02_49_10]
MSGIRRDDIVYVRSGKDKGKTGKVLRVYPKKGSILVEGINMVKKHMRRTKEDQQGGIISREIPLNASNVMPYCQKCTRPARAKVEILADGSKNRLCGKCGSAL